MSAGGRPSRGWSAALSLALLGVTACGGGAPEAQVPVAHETPEDEILRIAKSWQSSVENKGFRTAPSPISMFVETLSSTLAFTKGSSAAVESVVYDGSFKVRDTTYRCQARADVRVSVTFGRHAGEAAVEVRRPAARVPRSCDLPGFPEPLVDVPASAARYALRGDRLVAFAPPTERRAYLPAQ